MGAISIFAVAHLEGPPLAFASHNGNVNGKTCKNNISAMKSATKVLQSSS